MFTEWFTFNDDNATQLRKATLWKICLPSALKRKIPPHQTEQTCPAFTDSSRRRPSKRDLPPSSLLIGQIEVGNISREKLHTLLTFP